MKRQVPLYDYRRGDKEGLNKKPDVHVGLSFLGMCFNAVVKLENKEPEEYWEALSICICKNKNNFREFLKKPHWGEIKNWLIYNSFKYDLYKDDIEKKFDLLIKTCEVFFKAFNSCDGQIINESCINYLGAYYDLVIRLEQSGILRDDLISCSALLQMMMTGYFRQDFSEYDSKKNNYFYFFYSPVFLEKLRIFYNFLNANEKSEIDNTNIFYDVLREKFIKIFFADINIATKRYVTTYYNNGCPYLTDRDDLSSVEPIRPIRWIDKIRAYIECCLETGEKFKINENNEYEISVAVIGYVKLDKNSEEGKLYSDELKLFGSTLCLLHPDFVFNVEIYINNKDRNFSENDEGVMSVGKVNICLHKADYSKLFSPDKSPNAHYIIIKEIIDKHDIVFLLDVPNLYTHEYKLFRRSSKSFPDGYFEYNNEYEKLDFQDNDYLVSNYKYAPIHFLISKINLIAMNTNAYEDTLEYNINAPLIDYLKRYIKVKKSNSLKDIHMFI